MVSTLLYISIKSGGAAALKVCGFEIEKWTLEPPRYGDMYFNFFVVSEPELCVVRRVRTIVNFGEIGDITLDIGYYL